MKVISFSATWHNILDLYHKVYVVRKLEVSSDGKSKFVWAKKTVKRNFVIFIFVIKSLPNVAFLEITPSSVYCL